MDSQSAQTRSGDAGFTLIELLIVIVILGILATVAVWAVDGTTQAAQTNVCFTDQGSVQTAVEAYFVQHDGTYPTGGDDGTFLNVLYGSGLLREEPTTPEIWRMAPDGQVTVAPICENV